jgi:predicted Zn finger-like uncharacterized protein
MILTCPECATSYFVDDARIPPRGRMVKCSSCGARWRARPEDEAEPEAALDDDLVVEGPDADSETGGPGEDLEFVAAPVTPPRSAPARPRRRGLFIGAGVAAAVVAALATTIALRQHVAAAIPGAAPLFGAVGLPVDRLGLVIEGVTSTPTFVGGRPVLSVTGAVRNTRDRPVEVPPIRISLLGRDGKPVVTKLADPIEPRTVPPGARRYFAIGLPDPPAGARDLEIGFEPGARPQPPGAPDARQEHE